MERNTEGLPALKCDGSYTCDALNDLLSKTFVVMEFYTKHGPVRIKSFRPGPMGTFFVDTSIGEKMIDVEEPVVMFAARNLKEYLLGRREKTGDNGPAEVDTGQAGEYSGRFQLET